MIDRCDDLCKYLDEENGCSFHSMGSGNVKDMPCYYERIYSKWEQVRVNPNMMHCANCKGTWWNREKFLELFRFCPECGAVMDGKDGNNGI